MPFNSGRTVSGLVAMSAAFAVDMTAEADINVSARMAVDFWKIFIVIPYFSEVSIRTSEA
jgi:hypothetical protein